MFARGKQSLSRQARGGFTLLELVITVAVAGIIATLAVPNLSGLRSQAREEGDVVEVQTFLESARSRAHTRLTPLSVEVNAGVLEALDGATVVLSQALGDQLTSVTILTADNKLPFNGDGGLDTDGPINLNVVTRRGVTHRITIYPAIGALRRQVL